jgi:hypothetical protein
LAKRNLAIGSSGTKNSETRSLAEARNSAEISSATIVLQVHRLVRVVLRVPVAHSIAIAPSVAPTLRAATARQAPDVHGNAKVRLKVRAEVALQNPAPRRDQKASAKARKISARTVRAGKDNPSVATNRSAARNHLAAEAVAIVLSATGNRSPAESLSEEVANPSAVPARADKVARAADRRSKADSVNPAGRAKAVSASQAGRAKVDRAGVRRNQVASANQVARVPDPENLARARRPVAFVVRSGVVPVVLARVRAVHAAAVRGVRARKRP